MAILTMHHWDDWAAGLAELCRVAPRRVVLTMDFELHSRFWFLRGLRARGAASTPGSWDPGTRRVGRRTRWRLVNPAPRPPGHEDGVLGAYWCRPEAYLDPAVRANCSGLALADPAVVARGVAALEADLSSGAWHGGTPTWPSCRRSTWGTGWSWRTRAEGGCAGTCQHQLLQRLGCHHAPVQSTMGLPGVSERRNEGNERTNEGTNEECHDQGKVLTRSADSDEADDAPAWGCTPLRSRFRRRSQPACSDPRT